jgi:hypothetical protein
MKYFSLKMQLATLFGAIVILSAVAKGEYDKAYMKGFAEGVEDTVLLFKAQKRPAPDIQLDTVYVDTLTGRFRI